MASAVKGTCSPVKIEKTTLADRVWISEYHVARQVISCNKWTVFGTRKLPNTSNNP